MLAWIGIGGLGHMAIKVTSRDGAVKLRLPRTSTKQRKNSRPWVQIMW